VAQERIIELNAVGDVVLRDAEAMRALADPLRLDLLDRIRRSGAATIDELAGADTSAAEVAEHLSELRRVGFVTVEDDRWSAVGNGLVFEIPDEPDGQAAARQLTNVMLLKYADLPRRWVQEHEPALDVDWARAAGMFNARLTLTADELRELQEELERWIEPFVNRGAEAVPAGAAPVRILGYFLPEARREA
jgi:DNA-binding transcriptional ArsR family regulator